MLFKTNSKRVGWRVFTLLLAAASCVCYIFGGAFIQSVPAGQLDYGYILYFCMLVALISSSLLLAIGATAVDTTVNYRLILMAGTVFAAGSSAFLLIRDIADSARGGLLAPSGPFNNLTYLVVDAALLGATIVLVLFFLGKTGGRAGLIAAAVFLAGNILFAVGVLLHFTSGSAFSEGSALFNLLYPWTDGMALAAAAAIFVMVKKLGGDAKAQQGK